jgi:mannose-6-phosphate isomerase-like protein (cupin superfamily)
MIHFTHENDPKNIKKKKWGEEVMIHNKEYCGKILRFREGGKFSMHFHSEKAESWYVSKGVFWLTFIDTQTAERRRTQLHAGDIIDVGRNSPHQIEAITEGEIFEVSTEDNENDSYRVEKGDSQQ